MTFDPFGPPFAAESPTIQVEVKTYDERNAQDITVQMGTMPAILIEPTNEGREFTGMRISISHSGGPEVLGELFTVHRT